METSKLLLSLLLLSTFHSFSVSCTVFNVGGKNGWVVPKSKNDQRMYNHWASKNRFSIDDTLQFNYNKDSVMVVTEAEYEKCHSVRPIFYSNDGATIFRLDRPGLFYFMSGVAGHCEKGQKMIIKVLEPASPPQQSADQNATESILAPPKKSDAAGVAMAATSTAASIIMAFLGVFFF